MLATIVLTASQHGTIRTISSASVMTSTAMPRRLPAWRCTWSIRGQVAMTSVTAQTIAGRNGRMIQTQATISPAMNRTDSVVRARSWCAWAMLLGSFVF